MKRLAFAAVFPALVLAAWAHSTFFEVPGQPARRILRQPADWVAFVADVDYTAPGKPSVLGRFYRGSDGSTRLDTGPTRDVIEVISINNVSDVMHYEFSASRGWISQPMILPPDGHKPRPMPADLAGLTVFDKRIQGFEVYAYTKGDFIELRAPQLNFFSVVLQQVASGARTEYHNIVLTEPAPHLFRPPADAVVKQLSTPGGIVYITGKDDPNAQVGRPPECATGDCRERPPNR